MISSAEIKRIKSLQQKKHREIEGLFIAETPKIIESLLKSNLEIIKIFATSSWIRPQNMPIDIPICIISEKELERISSLKSPNQVLALLKIPNRLQDNITQGYSLLLDDIRDPGNLGTIIRIADWFGIDRIICSIETADAYQPKTVQATMGSIGNIPIHYVNLKDLLQEHPTMKIYGAYLEGDNIYKTEFSEDAWILIGNEAHGISKEYKRFVSQPILIPNFSKDQNSRAESLNASIATAIICSEIRRKG